MNKVYTKGHVVRTERHRDGQTRKARGKKPSLDYKDLFLASPPTPKAQRIIKDTFARAISTSSIVNFRRFPLKIKRSIARAG